MSKQLLIDSIRQHNPTAQTDFLATFNIEALERYLTHLRHLSRPRGRHSAWVRVWETPAITTRHRMVAA